MVSKRNIVRAAGVNFQNLFFQDHADYYGIYGIAGFKACKEETVSVGYMHEMLADEEPAFMSSRTHTSRKPTPMAYTKTEVIT
jgi:hypothetical protein